MIHTGDCIEVMAGMAADSVDAIVTDPPYGLEFMGKEWDAFKANGKSAKFHSPKDEGRVFTNESGHMWDNTKALPRLSAGHPFQQWCEAWGREALRVTKPGGYLLAFGGTRTHHRLVCGLEDAGWIIRDELDWIYASGFPKGKANLKPAHEPIVLARKPGPLQPLAIDACRIPGAWTTWRRSDGTINPSAGFADEYVNGIERPEDVRNPENAAGRWPSNVLLSDPALFDEKNAEVVGSGAVTEPWKPIDRPEGYIPVPADGRVYNGGGAGAAYTSPGYGDSGGYSRFFIIPKADRADREPVLRGQLTPAFSATMNDGIGGREHNPEQPTAYRENAHPTVKPVDLMRHLVRLVTPSGGTVLDCFLGSGSTAIAAELEGFPWVGIEKEPEYVAIAEARLNGTQRGLGLDIMA